ncbi:MAG: DUF362 domain-containing protein [Armatimonadota bacterium]
MVKTTRREFLKQVAFAGAALKFPKLANAAFEDKSLNNKSRVVIVTDKNIISRNNQVNQAVAKEMLDKSIAKLMKTKTSKEAWQKIFGPDDVIGIKVNALFGVGVSTHPEVAYAVAEALQASGVKPENIIIWDRNTSELIKSGFKPKRDGIGVQCYADDGDWGSEIEQGSFKGRITKFIESKCTAIINVPILKTHSNAGVSICLKNHYGSMDNPSSHHANHCNPMIADFNAIPIVKNKTRLVVIDAVRPQYDGGPGLKADSQFDYYSLIVSQDPLAADYEGIQIIQNKRKENGLDAIPAKKLAWLDSANERGVGTNNPDKIDLIKV